MYFFYYYFLFPRSKSFKLSWGLSILSFSFHFYGSKICNAWSLKYCSLCKAILFHWGFWENIFTAQRWNKFTFKEISVRFLRSYCHNTVKTSFCGVFFYHWGLAAECTEEVITLCVIRNQVWIKPDCIWAGWSYDAVGQPHNFNFHYGTKLILSLIYFLLLFHSSSNAMQSWHIPQQNEIPLHELLENRTGNYTQWAW